MNRDEGSYQLSHKYDRLVMVSRTRRIEYQLLLMYGSFILVV